MRKAYTFDDVALIPQFNNVPSRTEPSLETWLTRTIKLSIPLVAANMDSVIGADLAQLLITRGSVPIFHRFTSIENQIELVKKFPKQAFVSAGINDLELILKLIDQGALGACLDIAHGHSETAMKFVSQLKSARPDAQIIAGNVCTAMAYHDLVNAGADAVKVGVGPGAACTTRMVTGFGVPQFTAIRDCAQIAERLRVPLIADGGIKSSRELVLALAAGASTVMMGKLFSLTEESAAEKRINQKTGKKECKYRGQASENFQNDFYGGLKKDTVAEGVDFWADVTGSADALIDNLLGGLRSGLTYGGARNIKEFQRKAEFLEVTATYMKESMPRHV
jgi:IMP dehydrogenase